MQPSCSGRKVKLKFCIRKSKNPTLESNYVQQRIQILWEEITEAINDIWPYIKIIFYQKDLLEKAQEAIETISNELEDTPEEATEIIKLLNTKDS